jgi:alanyl-tRNA synthetase
MNSSKRKNMHTSAEIRSLFLDYFERNGHQRVESSSLIPGNDPTLLFTNAGMVQFKDTFLGVESRGYNRATSSQRCVRAGGKHNDLENVGYTARHHTFFEMLGNFSFGDYFKREAIRFAWNFLTVELGLSPSQLWVTAYFEDGEAESIWLDEIGIDKERFSKLGDKDNFWSMGDTGPCGPCSEIFYDHGPEVVGGPPGSPEEDGDRYIEIWNLVFMQYERKLDGSLVSLPQPSVDTGAGLERIAAVMQGVHSNYEIDLFDNLISDISTITNVSDRTNNSLKVIADHIRSSSFLIIDGVIPSNEGRGYVLRRIVRRALRHGYRLGVKEVFFFKVVSPLVKVMGDAYPELASRQEFVEKILREEEEQFERTLENGMGILESAISNLSGKMINGETVFKLYDTYGFPTDLTADVARENGLTIDMQGFEKAMEVQREQARAAGKFSAVSKLNLSIDLSTDFIGYDHIEGGASVQGLYVEGEEVLELKKGQEGWVVLDRTPLYGESGGQVGDRGVISGDQFEFEVLDTQKQGDALIHRGVQNSGSLTVGKQVFVSGEIEERRAITLNHSATHLLHAALRQVLGSHVMQKGSLVDAKRLRFDFSHTAALDENELKAVEREVNAKVLQNTPVKKQQMALEDAKKSGAIALFGEKYGAEVRVVTMGEGFSVEFCGGTHVNNTGDISLIKIVSESGISAGVRRIEAVTGHEAHRTIEREEKMFKEICELVKSNKEDVLGRVKQMSSAQKELEKTVQQLKAKIATSEGGNLAHSAENIGELKLLVRHIDDCDGKELRETVDQLKNKLGVSIVVLASVEGTKVGLVAGVSKELTDRIKAGDLVNMVATQVGGKGGGRADMAMAGGGDPSALPAALDSVKSWVLERINK